MKTFMTLTLSLNLLSNTAFATFFDGVSQRKSQCYARAYSSNELANKPKQNVTHMAAKLYVEPLHFGTADETPIKFLKIQAKRRNDDRVYSVELACNKTGQCSIDCDGPRTQLQWSTSREGSIVIDARTEHGNYLSLDPILCGDDENAEAINFVLNGEAGSDDLFRLDPLPDYMCL